MSLQTSVVGFSDMAQRVLESLLTVALYLVDRRGTVSRTVTPGAACKLSKLLIQ
jgi:hypothetical protein